MRQNSPQKKVLKIFCKIIELIDKIELFLILQKFGRNAFQKTNYENFQKLENFKQWYTSNLNQNEITLIERILPNILKRNLKQPINQKLLEEVYQFIQKKWLN